MLQMIYKKFFPLFFLFIFSLTSYGQIGKGKTVVGLNAELQNFDVQNYFLNQTDLRVGHFLSDKIFLGLEANYGTGKGTNFNFDRFQIGLQGRYYHRSKWEKIKFFTGLGAGYYTYNGFLDDFNPATPNDYNQDAPYVRIDLGMTYILGQHWSVELSSQNERRFFENANSEGGIFIGVNFHF